MFGQLGDSKTTWAKQANLDAESGKRSESGLAMEAFAQHMQMKSREATGSLSSGGNAADGRKRAAAQGSYLRTAFSSVSPRGKLRSQHERRGAGGKRHRHIPRSSRDKDNLRIPEPRTPSLSSLASRTHPIPTPTWLSAMYYAETAK